MNNRWRHRTTLDLFLPMLMLLWGGLSSAHGGETTATTKNGPVSARLILSPEKSRLGDPLTLTLEVTAEPGIELLMPEFGQSLGRFIIVAFAPGEKIDPDGKTVSWQRHTLHPSMSGRQFIPPLLIEFIDRRPGHPPAPPGEDAHELITERLEFTVDPVAPQDAALELKPPPQPLAPIKTLNPVPSGWLLPGLLTLALSLATLWIVARRRRRTTTIRTPYEIALFRLRRLKGEPPPTADEMDPFFVRLSAIIRHYLEDRFRIRAPEKTTEEFFEAAGQSPELTAEHRGFLFRFLEFSDQVKFARHRPTPDHVSQALQAAEDFLHQTGRTEAPHV
ncbi:MAG: hypothetical protein HQL76_11985 [Magnetococcales bacterium]|nr:hypothetical protein [Magnetococcales bacterium]